MESLVDIRCIIRITIAACYDAAVHACAVAVPDFEPRIRYWLACVDVDHLDVERERHSLLALCNVAANKLALDPVWALSCLGSEHTAVHITEERTLSRFARNSSQVTVVVGVEHIV